MMTEKLKKSKTALSAAFCAAGITLICGCGSDNDPVIYDTENPHFPINSEIKNNTSYYEVFRGVLVPFLDEKPAAYADRFSKIKDNEKYKSAIDIFTTDSHQYIDLSVTYNMFHGREDLSYTEHSPFFQLAVKVHQEINVQEKAAAQKAFEKLR